MPKLSIITCTFNSEKYLQQCINSVYNQNINSDDIIEHIFIDGNSTDKTLEIINKYIEGQSSYKVSLYTSPAKGIYNAMNIGISKAIGEYIMFLNSDDYLTEGQLVPYILFTDTLKSDIFFAKLNIIKNNKIEDTIPHFSVLNKIFFFMGFNSLVYHPTTLIKRSLFRELGYYDETQKIASDYGFWLNCIKNKKKFTFFPYVVTYFRIHDDSISSNKKNTKIELKENFYFRKKHLGLQGIVVHFFTLVKTFFYA